MKNSIYSPKLGHFLQLPMHFFFSATVFFFFLFSLSNNLHAVRRGGEMGVTFTFDPISHKSTFEYGAHDFKSLHFSNESFIKSVGWKLANQNFTDDINSIVTGATTNFGDNYNKCFYVQNSGNELKTGNGNRGAINFGSTRRPTDWLYKNGTRYTSGIDNFNNDKEYLSLYYLDIKTTKSADPKDATSEPEYGHTGTNGWTTLYPLSTVSFSRSHTYDTTETKEGCSNEEKYNMQNPNYPPTFDRYGSDKAWTTSGVPDCKPYNRIVDKMKLSVGYIESGAGVISNLFYGVNALMVLCGASSIKASGENRSFTYKGSTYSVHGGSYYGKIYSYEEQKKPTTSRENGTFTRANQGIGYAGCEFLPHVGDNSEFKVYGDIFKSAFTNLRINSPFKDGDGNTIDYGIPHLNPSNTTRLSVTCLGTV